jgi:hypothetical protein
MTHQGAAAAAAAAAAAGEQAVILAMSYKRVLALNYLQLS